MYNLYHQHSQLLLSVEILNLFRTTCCAKLCRVVCTSLCVLLVPAASFVSQGQKLPGRTKESAPVLSKFFRSRNR